MKGATVSRCLPAAVTNYSENLITGVTAVTGTLLGGLTSFATTYLTQGRQGRSERILRDLERRENLYASFLELSSQLALNALESSVDNARAVIGLSAFVARIRLGSSNEVLRVADDVVDYIIETYRQPPQDASEMILSAPREFTAPLAAFAQACREERDRMLRHL